MYKKILFPTDLSTQNLHSATKIAEMAKSLKASVEVLHVLPKSVPPPPEDIREGALKPFLNIFAKYGVETNPKHRYGNNPANEILKEIDDKDFDLVAIPAERIYSDKLPASEHSMPKSVVDPICHSEKCDVFVLKGGRA